jgi:cytochrome P450
LRKTHKPVTLSTGHTIPADTLVAALNPLYNASATPHIKDGDRFNPERWLRDNDDENQDAYWKFGSATTDSLIFGYGKHACPGRPFGVTMVKDILAFIISKWDVRLAGGVRKRPQNICMDFIVMPPIAPVGNLEIELKLR